MKFSEFGLKPEILQAIEKLGFESPLPVKEKAIPLLLENHKDLVGLAQTGTGKTAAFGLPIVHKIDIATKQPQALILAPTRELCLQITRDMESFAKYLPGLNIVSVYGGADIERQIRALKKGAQIIVATPGRMNDLLNKRKRIDLSVLKTVVLDEADEMLNMGFKEELDAILEQAPKSKQTLLFSATMSKEVQRIAATYMQPDAESITVGNKNSGADTVSHVLYSIRSKDRYLALKRILDFNPNVYGIVFCRTRMETKRVAAKLIGDEYNADALHGDLSQAQREYIMQKFRVRNLQILVATDVAARGLDVKDVTHVINYELPDDISTYTHRSGRTGRAGQTGISIVLAHLKEKGKIKRIERALSKNFEVCNVPTGKEVCEQQLLGLIERMQNTEVNHEEVDKFLPVIREKLANLDKEELLKRFISLEFNRFFDYYKNQNDLLLPDSRSEGGDRGERRGRYRDRRSDRRSERSSRDRSSDRRGDRNDERPRRDRSDSRDERSSERPERRERRDDRSNNRDDSRGERPNRSSERRGEEQEFARFFVNLGHKDGVSPRDVIELISTCTEKKNINIGKIDLMKSFSFFEIDKKYTTDVLKGFNDIHVNNKDVFVELALEDPKTSGGSRPVKRKSRKSDGFERRKKRTPKPGARSGSRSSGGSDYRSGDRPHKPARRAGAANPSTRRSSGGGYNRKPSDS
jgi:ATP-dependent RNA helicase DeaD